jgi:hypothetical protein
VPVVEPQLASGDGLERPCYKNMADEQVQKAFPCPRCNSLREAHLADCPFCGWQHRSVAEVDPQQAEHRPCPCCGSQSYAWGWLSEGRGEARFLEDDGSLLHELGLGGERLRARKCLRCGNLQLFARAN